MYVRRSVFDEKIKAARRNTSKLPDAN